MKKIFLLILLVSSVTHAEKLIIIPKYTTGYGNQMFLDIDTIHSGEIKGINRLNTIPTGQYVIIKYEIDCKAGKFNYPKGPNITYDQYGKVVSVTENENVPTWDIDLSVPNVFTFLYKKYCKQGK